METLITMFYVTFSEHYVEHCQQQEKHQRTTEVIICKKQIKRILHCECNHLIFMLTSSATDCLAHVFFTWLYIIVLLIPSPQNITNACVHRKM